MRMNCEMLDLRAFLAVLDLGSFHRAATVLNISQPALSRRIKALEESMGGRLFERSTRRVRPTRAGLNFEPLARRVVDEFDYAISRVCQFGSRDPGQLTISAIPTVAGSFLPSVLEQFRETYPGIRMRILDIPGKEGLETVARGEAEFGINYLGTSHSEFQFTPLLDDYFTVVCRHDHPFARRRSLRWRDLADQPLVISQNNSNRIMVDQALSKSQISLNWTFEVLHLSTSFGLVASGTAMAILPSLATHLADPPLAGVRLEDPVVSRTMGIVQLRKRQLSPAAAKLRELLIKRAQSHAVAHQTARVRKRRLATA
jgi:DNA-binding transcriptional LysR family regulator